MDDLRSDCKHEEEAPICLPTGDLSLEPQEERSEFARCGTESPWPATSNRDKTDCFRRYGVLCQLAT